MKFLLQTQRLINTIDFAIAVLPFGENEALAKALHAVLEATKQKLVTVQNKLHPSLQKLKPKNIFLKEESIEKQIENIQKFFASEFSRFEEENQKHYTSLEASTVELINNIKQQIQEGFIFSADLKREECLKAVYEREFEQKLQTLWNTLNQVGIKPPQVFISYSWGNLGQQSWVHRLAEHLQGCKINSIDPKIGLNVILDVQDNRTNSVTRFTEGIVSADKVLVVGTRLLAKKWNSPDKKVVPFEMIMVGNRLRDQYNNHGIIKILLEGEPTEAFPNFMRDLPISETDFRLEQNYYAHFFTLLELIYNDKPEAIKIFAGIKNELDQVFNELDQLDLQQLQTKLSPGIQRPTPAPGASMPTEVSLPVPTPFVDPINASIQKKIAAMHATILKEYLAADEKIPELNLYVGPYGCPDPLATVTFPLKEKIAELMRKDKKVILILGEAGAGKSLFLQNEAKDFIKSRAPESNSLIIFISLPLLPESSTNLIEETLIKYDFTPNEIDYIRKNYQIKVFLDSVDERNKLENFFVTHKLQQWQATLLMTCRSSFLATVDSYRTYFMPVVNEKPIASWFEEIHVAPFNNDQIGDYIKQYVDVFRDELYQDWLNPASYEKFIREIPGLALLISNPFLLSIVVPVLPTLAREYLESLDGEQKYHFDTNKLIDLFVRRYFERQIFKKMQNGQRVAPNETQNYFLYARKLAITMKAKNVTQVTYERSADLFDEPQTANDWDKFFSFENNPKLRGAFDACPLVKVKTGHNLESVSFRHSLFLEYFAASAIYADTMSAIAIPAMPQGTYAPQMFPNSTAAAEMKTQNSQTFTMKRNLN